MLDFIKRSVNCVIKRINKENVEKETIKVCLTVSTSLWIYYILERLNNQIDDLVLYIIITIVATCYSLPVIIIPLSLPKNALSLILTILRREIPMFVFGYYLFSGVLIKPRYCGGKVSCLFIITTTVILLLMLIIFCATVDGRNKIDKGE